MRVVFLGTPQFACPALRALHSAGHEIVWVVTQPDRPQGRGQRTSLGPVQTLARELSLPTLTLQTGSRLELYARLLEAKPDVAIVVAFGHIVREPLLNGPRFGCLNLHASLLPRWRGAAPIQRAIVAGDRESGVSLMRLDAGLDTGPVYAVRTTIIGAEETAGELSARLAEMGAELLLQNLAAIAAGLTPQLQGGLGVSHAPRLHKREGSADLGRPAMEVAARVRGLSPWPAVTLLHGAQRLKLLRVRAAVASPPTQAGRLRVDETGALVVECGDGALQLLSVQPEGRAAMSGIDYWRGAGSRAGESVRTLPDFQAEPGS